MAGSGRRERGTPGTEPGGRKSPPETWFTVLGPLRAGRGDVELDVGPSQQRAVMAVLLLRHGTPTPVEGLIDALWDGVVPGSAASTVRTYISRLRRTLESGAAGSVIRSVSGGYQVDLAPHQLDLAVFRQSLAEAEQARVAGDISLSAEQLIRGLGLWRGTPLAGLPGPFAARQRANLERLRASAEASRLRAELDLGDPDRVLPELAALTAEHPLDERLRETLITALYRAGRQAEALASYEETRSLLAVELGIDPGPALQALHERILRADPALMRAGASQTPPAGAGPVPRPPDGPVLGNLPQQVSSFIGRDAELAEVRALVAGARLVTLTGAGGAGKTRLALQVAAGLQDGAGDGVWFADLASLRDPELIAATVADLLGIRRDPGREVTEALMGAVGERSLLVLLDNCEHVVAACAKLADTLLRGCPNLALLATSREPLGIGGERVYRVPSLSIPAEGADAVAIRASEAVRLLADRAAAQGVALAWNEELARVAGRICRRLDGIPLAIELAAARLRVVPPDELESRLDQRFILLTGGSRAAMPRQRTLQAMVDWSWELLTSAERAVLARLSVFARGFDLAAAEAVATGPDVPAAEVIGLLGALVDKSLVQFGDTGTGPGRYRLLETVRQYAAGQLDALEPGAAVAARIAHRDYYLALAEEAAPQLMTAGQARWLGRLDAERSNLRAALAVSLTQHDPVPGLRLAASLRDYWSLRGYAVEGVGVLRALLESPGAREATLPRARALAAASWLLIRTDGYAIAGDYCQEALTIARTIEDEYLAADLLHQQSWVLLHQGQPAAGISVAESGLILARRLGDLHLSARLLSARASVTHAEGHHAVAARDLGEALALFRRTGDRLQTGQMLGNLGYQELSVGSLDAARLHLAEALGISRELNDRFATVYQTFNLGLAEYLGGSPEAAGTLFAESLDVARRTGMRTQVGYALIGLALADHGLAGPERAARLHGAADQALADLGHAVEPLEASLAERDRQRLRVAMGDEAFEAEYAAGRGLSPADVLAALASPAASTTRTT